jgi:hypothetical protein
MEISFFEYPGVSWHCSLFMPPTTFRHLRYIIASAIFLFMGYSYAHAQVLCETGYFSEYATNGHLLPTSITTLRNGQQVITGKVTLTAAARTQGMVVRISETGDVVWSIALDAGEGAVFKGMLEKGNGLYIIYGSLYSAGDPDGKIWLVCLDQAGNMQWNRTMESGKPGAEQLYSLIEMPDGDLVGTFNIADNSSTSRPVVFRMHDNGTLLCRILSNPSILTPPNSSIRSSSILYTKQCGLVVFSSMLFKFCA